MQEQEKTSQEEKISLDNNTTAACQMLHDLNFLKSRPL